MITSGIKTMTRLAEYGVRVISTGGNVMNTCLSLIGNGAQATIHSYYADICFFSCRGLSLNGELSDISVDENIVRQAMIARSKSAYLLCSHNKLDRQYYHKLCDLSVLSGLICDSALPESLQRYAVGSSKSF